MSKQAQIELDLKEITHYVENTYMGIYSVIPQSGPRKYGLLIRCNEGILTNALIRHMDEKGYRFRNVKTVDDQLIALFEY